MIHEDVIKKAAQGDVESFEVIFKAYADFVFNVSLRILKNREDAQDVAQEVFMKIYRDLKTFRFQSNVKTWIYRVTVNMAINRAKKESRTRNRTVEYDDALSPNNARGTRAQTFEKEYTQSVIDALLGVLTPDQRACIVLRNIEGLTYEEIARALNIHINSVRSRIKRARWKFLAIKKEVMPDAV